MRSLQFLEVSDTRRLFSSMYVVFATSLALPKSIEELVTASDLKRKFTAVSVPSPNGGRLDFVLKPGPQRIDLKESEWDYLLSRLKPPAGQWTNFGADEALAALALLRELPSEPE